MRNLDLRKCRRHGNSTSKADKALTEFGHLVPKALASLNLPPHADFDDLLSVGRVALMKAANHLRPGATRECYLRTRIRGAMIDYIRSVTWIPRGTLERRRRLDQAVAALEMKLGRAPDDREIAKHLGMTLEHFSEWQLRAQVHALVSTQSGMSDHGEGPSDLLDTILDEHALDPAAEAEKHDLVEAIYQAIQQLPQKLQQILALYYHEDLQMQEIARVLEVTESRVSQMHGQAIQLVKRHLSSCAAREGLLRNQ